MGSALAALALGGTAQLPVTPSQVTRGPVPEAGQLSPKHVPNQGPSRVLPQAQTRAMASCLDPIPTQVYAREPILTQSTKKVNSWARFQVTRLSCYDTPIKVLAQTKACGFWGCNYETRGSNSENLTVRDRTLHAMQDCRSGTNRYRTYAAISFWIPVHPTHYETQSVTDAVHPEFTCG